LALKAIIGKLEDVAEAVRGFYKQQGDKFVLEFEGSVPGFVAEAEHNAVKASLTEFRDNNITVLKERDQLKEQFKDLDPAAARAALAEIEKLKGKGVKGSEDLEKLIAAAVAPLTEQITGLKTSLSEKDAAAARAALRSKLSDAFLAAGVKRSALVDALNRVKDGQFKLDGDRLIEMNGDQPRFSEKNPGKARDASEWIAELSTGDGAHLFEPNKGGGANAGSGSGDGPAKTIAFDNNAFLQNLDGIAKGEVAVQ
jgi:hypothetical protein